MKNFSHPYIDTFFHFEEIGSTNVKAIELIKSGRMQGNFLLIADLQKKGMGRGNKFWVSPAGGLWFTFGLYGLPITSNLTIFAGLIFLKILSEFDESLAAEVKIKWPNDLYLGDKKLAGILTNYLSQQKYHVLGCGINTNVDFSNHDEDIKAISLSGFLQREVRNEELLSAFITTFFQQLPQFIETGIDRSYYTAHDYLLGKQILISTEYANYSGTYKGILPEGAILIKLDNGFIQPFYAGSVSIISTRT